MPRKRNGWGNPDSLRFPPLGYANPPQYKAVGQIPSNNQFGSTITRSVTEHYDLNTDWKAWVRGYEIYSHGKFKQSDYTLKFKQYEGTTDETTVYLRFYEYPTNVSDSGNRTVTIRYTDILNAGAGGGDTGADFDYRTGLTNVFKVKNQESDYASREEYLKQKGKGQIPVVLNRYNNSLITQVRRAQPGSRLTDGFYSGNLIDLEDKDGLPVRLYGRTYKNLKLVGNDEATKELQKTLNISTYKYKIRQQDFLRLTGEQTAVAAKDWVDSEGILDNFVGKLAVPLSFWNDFEITVSNTHEGLALKEERFGEIYNIDLDVSLFRFFKIFDITQFPNTVYSNKDFKVLFETLKITPVAGQSGIVGKLPINNEEDPEDGSAEVQINSHYIFINNEYKRFYGKAATKEQLDEIYRKVTTASLTIEAANVTEVIDHRTEPGFDYTDDDAVWLTIVCSPPKQEIQLFTPFDDTDNTVTGIFDASSFSYKAWSNGNSFFNSYTSNQFKRNLNPKQVEETGFIELKADPWSYKHQDMWTNPNGFQPLIYDILFSCSCPGYTHSLAKAPESTGPDRSTKSNRQEKYPLPGALSRALTSDGDEDSVAGNAIQWIDSRYETSFKNCKHTIASMFEFGLQVKEPLETPTEKNREKFLEKLYEERQQFDYLKVNPSSVQRGDISNFDIGLSMLNSVNIPSTNPSRILETPDVETEVVVVPVSQNQPDRSAAATETIRIETVAIQEAIAQDIPAPPPVVTVEDIIEEIAIEEADPEIENTHQPIVDFGETKRLISINPPLPGGFTEWDFPTKGDLELTHPESLPTNSFTEKEYNFRVLDEITVTAELYGAGGSSGPGMVTRYWPYEPSVAGNHNTTNEETYYITNQTTANIDSTASEQDSNYKSAATPADTNYYEGAGGIAKGKITLTPGIEYRMTIGQTGQINGLSRLGGGKTQIHFLNSSNSYQPILTAGGGGSASARYFADGTITYLSPGGHGGFGANGNGSDGVQGFREDPGNTPINPGRGATETADGLTPTAIDANDGTSGSGEYRGGRKGLGRFEGSSGLHNNGQTAGQRGASGGGGGSSFGDPAYVSEISYQGTPVNTREKGKLVLKAEDT